VDSRLVFEDDSLSGESLSGCCCCLGDEVGSWFVGFLKK